MSEGTANQFWKPQVFFQQLYSKKSTNNKFCYGMGHSHPSVPFIFETLENGELNYIQLLLQILISTIIF